ncbi:hypothetical protein BIV60_11990 [Bacillus sp. MUM 116]|uniref:hypothetical protein n=1 Tax=Bacillus sp. MUM 116 TaxID=1678002 RepID=UPI0008F568E2|nr:hypothetical protein [Bacillus sp. MUM 116]OIK14223.1 hypothetical protein BIV60_11990 [Bacillus sp. MUM 116]
MLKALQNYLINRAKNKEQQTDLSAQDAFPVEDIRDDVAVTKDNRLVAVFWISTINLDLMSLGEQSYVFDSFEAFLAGLDGNIQFENVAQPVNLQDYTRMLVQKHEVEENEHKRRLQASYALFAYDHQTHNKIFKKEHYVIIDQKIIGDDDLAYKDALDELNQRAKELEERIRNMFGRDFTLDCYRLTNQQLMYLFQVFYNYAAAMYQPIEEAYVPQVIRKGGEKPDAKVVYIAG